MTIGKKDPYYCYGPIANLISRNRFMEIGRYLHIVGKSTLAQPEKDGYDICKVRPVLKYLSGWFTGLYNPKRDCGVDETMIQLKGWSNMRQYIPKKNYEISF